MKCDYCMKEVTPECDWRQGRCPYRPAMIETSISYPYKDRFINLINLIKNIFK